MPVDGRRMHGLLSREEEAALQAEKGAEKAPAPKGSAPW
jgi:hypothetical protein